MADLKIPQQCPNTRGAFRESISAWKSYVDAALTSLVSCMSDRLSECPRMTHSRP